jgi:hypothetical protein
MSPKARKDKLTVRELANETLIYDREQNKAHCLNTTAALVWRHCDERTTLPNLAAKLGLEQPLVQLAVEQLSRRNLLESPVKALSGTARLSRRDTLRKLAVAAALPIVMTMSVKSARAAGASQPTSSTPPPPCVARLAPCTPGVSTCCTAGDVCSGTPFQCRG